MDHRELSARTSHLLPEILVDFPLNAVNLLLYLLKVIAHLFGLPVWRMEYLALHLVIFRTYFEVSETGSSSIKLFNPLTFILTLLNFIGSGYPSHPNKYILFYQDISVKNAHKMKNDKVFILCMSWYQYLSFLKLENLVGLNATEHFAITKLALVTASVM